MEQMPPARRPPSSVAPPTRGRRARLIAAVVGLLTVYTVLYTSGSVGAAGEAVGAVIRRVRGGSHVPTAAPPVDSWTALTPSGVRLQPHGDELAWYSDDWGGPR